MGDHSDNKAIVILGTGHAATVLGKRMVDRGHRVIQVWGRTPASAQHLAETLGAQPLTDLNALSQSADLYLLAVADDALPDLAGRMPALTSVVAHTAGSVAASVLQSVSPHYGVLYPLQSLRKDYPEIPVIPFLVQGSDTDTEHRLRSFARTLSGIVSHAGDEDRRRLHLAAVFTSNFCNHLCSLTDDYLAQHGQAFHLLLPLLEETVGRFAREKPANLQTGPATRGDQQTQQRHLSLLENEPAMQAIYTLLSQSIQSYHLKNPA